MKKTSKKLTANQENERTQWIKLLEHVTMFHMQMVKETHNPIIGAKQSENHVFHQACASAIEDCVLLIEMLDEEGWFGDDDVLPQHKAGPIG
jgi:hypothetical protein